MTTNEITAEQRFELVQKHGEVLVLGSDFGDVAFRIATRAEWQRMIDEQARDLTQGVALRNLVYSCRVWPEGPDFDRLIERAPGMVQSLGNELVEFCGLGRRLVRKK